MDGLLSLDNLGPRICIMGPSNSGKSTLAEAISRKTAMPAVHLDQLYHLPNTNWQPRDINEFLRLHAKAIGKDRWVMEGNYTRCITQRLERATGFILLDLSTAASLMRYIKRCYSTNGRVGALEGGQDKVNWGMIKHITLVTPANRKRYRKMYDQINLPKLLLINPMAVREGYRQWRL